MKGKAWKLTALIALTALAGCLGGDAEKLDVSHVEASEESRITIESVPRSGFTYESLFLMVDGKKHSFGEFASFDERRFQVEGKRDIISQVEQGDILILKAAGTVSVEVLRDDRQLASFEANIPDNQAPAAPNVLDPPANADGVSRTPTFRWSPVTDPSGLSYTLVYSIDPAFQTPAVTVGVEGLSAPTYTVTGGKELLAGMTYHWRVRAIDAASNASPWSQSAEFAVAGGPAG